MYNMCDLVIIWMWLLSCLHGAPREEVDVVNVILVHYTPDKPDVALVLEPEREYSL